MADTALFIDAKTASEILCVKVSTIYSWIHYKQIPDKIYRKLGRKIIFIQKELIEWFINGAKISKRNA